MSRLTKTLCLISFCLFASTLAVANGVHPLFNLQSTTSAPFPTDRFTLADAAQNTDRRIDLPTPNCLLRPSDCVDVALLNQLDGFNTQPRISIPFDGAIDPATVNSNTVFVIRVADTSNPSIFNPEIIGINQVVWDTLTNTPFVQTDEHLDQHTTYLLIVTKDVHDSAGEPIEAGDSFVHFRRNLNFGQTKDPQLKAYRKSLIDLLDDDVLATLAPGVVSSDIAVASVFTTGSVTSTLESSAIKSKLHQLQRQTLISVFMARTRFSTSLRSLEFYLVVSKMQLVL